MNELSKIFKSNFDIEKSFSIIEKLLAKNVKFKLFTLTVFHPTKKKVMRIYSTNHKVYPVGGFKPIPNNYWSVITINRKKSFIGNNKNQIKKYFFDHRVITDLGCEAILNQVVVFNDKTIGTLNLLNDKNHFKSKHLKVTDTLSKYLVPIFLSFQLKLLRQK